LIPKRILIVEDAVDIATSMQELLVAEGYQVSAAATGRQALLALQAAPTLPDLILLDLMMPDMDGYQFRRAQREDPRLAAVPVLLMTASGDPHTQVEALEARGVLRKPFGDLDSILDAISRAL
jgi:CheY-like chemotaxis protein